MGVTQKYLVVTANYAARAAGVGKLMGIQEARAKCPNLVLVRADVSQLAFHVFLPISELTISSVRCHSGLRGIGPLEVCTVGGVLVHAALWGVWNAAAKLMPIRYFPMWYRFLERT